MATTLERISNQIRDSDMDTTTSNSITNRTEAMMMYSYELQRTILLASHQEAAQLLQAFTLQRRNHMAARMTYEHRVLKSVHQLVRPLHTADREDQSMTHLHEEVPSHSRAQIVHTTRVSHRDLKTRPTIEKHKCNCSLKDLKQT